MLQVSFVILQLIHIELCLFGCNITCLCRKPNMCYSRE